MPSFECKPGDRRVNQRRSRSAFGRWSASTLCAALVAMVLATMALSQPIPNGPAAPVPAATGPAAAQAEPLRATITAARGLAEVKVAEGVEWQPAKAGMLVDEGGEFRTGPRSAIQFAIPPGQVVTLDRLGTVKLLTAVREAGGKVRTDLGMKYGRTRYDITTGGEEHESTIRSPNSTLAVRGTMVSLTDSRPFPPEAISLTGRAQFQAFKKQSVAFGGASKARIQADKGTAAETALDRAVLDPTFALSRDRAEAALVADLISRGAVVSLDRDTGFRVVRGGSVPNDSQLVGLLPGNLNFVLRWTGNANLDLQIGNLGAGESVYPTLSLSSSRSGGHIAFDHQGGPLGGIELTSWPASFPRDTYTVGINHVSGPAVQATFEVFRDGKLCMGGSPPFGNPNAGCILTFDANGLPVQTSSVTFESAPIVPGKNVELYTPGIVDLTGVAPLSVRNAGAKPASVQVKDGKGKSGKSGK